MQHPAIGHDDAKSAVTLREIRSSHDLRRQTDLMATGYLFHGIGGKNFRISGINGNAAAGNADPLHTGLDALKAHG